MKKLLLILSLAIGSNSFADSHIDFSLSDFCYLQPNVQDRNGVYYFPNQTKGITANSLCVFKNAYGQYFSKGKLVNGKKEGNWIKWDRNGVKAFDTYYKNGKKEGKEIYIDLLGAKTENFFSEGEQIKSNRYNLDGTIRKEQTYTDGELSYETFYSYHDNGQLKMKGNQFWPEIDFDGVITSWYENGQKEHESFYSDRELKGKATWWYENGQISMETYNGKDDSFSGEDRYWYENGQLEGISTWKNGKSISFKSWHANGAIHHDYIYPNGIKEGEYIRLDKHGKVYAKATYENGKCISGDCY